MWRRFRVPARRPATEISVLIMGWREVRPSDQVTAADWIRERLHGFAVDVGSVLPSGFEAYARIFHPAWKQRQGLDDPEEEVSWSAVAEWNGKVAHPEMQFHSIGGPWQGEPQKQGPGVYEPRLGVMSERQGRAVAQILSRHTATPDSCWMCLWDGYGELHPGGSVSMLFAFEAGKGPHDPPVIPDRAFPPQRERVKLPHRDYLLFQGAVVQAAGWDEGPNLWWPDDRAWCVASEIDFPYTYVGGSAGLIDEILRDPDLEALQAKLSDGITAFSDNLNA